MQRYGGWVLLATMVLVTSGCSSDQFGDRVDVTGTVKLKGQPIKDGAIIDFSPVDNQSTGANAGISGGAFKISREGGLKPGTYLVRVTASDGTVAANPVDPDALPGPGGGTNVMFKELVPADWNVNSKQQVKVTKDGPNKFEFNIP